MYINIMGHVKSPGTYLVYEGTDILTILAQAGGYLRGAKLSHMTIHHRDGDSEIVDLDDYLKNGNLKVLNLEIKPNDTIYIKQKLGSYIFSQSSVLNSVLQILTLYVTLTKID